MDIDIGDDLVNINSIFFYNNIFFRQLFDYFLMITFYYFLEKQIINSQLNLSHALQNIIKMNAPFIKINYRFSLFKYKGTFVKYCKQIG